MAPATKHLLIINVVLWLAAIILPKVNPGSGFDLAYMMALHFWKGSDFNVLQLFSTMFMHDTHGVAHILFNMFTLVMFGSLLERIFGLKRYLLFYVLCGLGSSLLLEAMWQFTWQDVLLQSVNAPAGTTAADVINAANTGHADFTLDEFFNYRFMAVGASGAIMGLMTAFAMLFPDMKLYIMFIPVPVKAKWALIGFFVLSLVFGATGALDSIAHFGHLGGMIVGFIIVMIWKRLGIIDNHGYYR